MRIINITLALLLGAILVLEVFAPPRVSIIRRPGVSGTYASGIYLDWDKTAFAVFDDFGNGSGDWTVGFWRDTSKRCRCDWAVSVNAGKLDFALQTPWFLAYIRPQSMGTYWFTEDNEPAS